ncbi:MAG TPA: DUF87 domain-containing protein, partial [Candidatus Aenigmarchaeota archaeon]|nr:DUF87 domain-containing protein [Candidatus Aenigmarchaeota archaeon]
MAHEIVIGRRREDLEKYGKEGTGFIGKHIVGRGEGAHLTVKVLMDFLRPHVIMVVGKRGCLPADHLVFTRGGYKPISKVKNGEEVLSLNLEKLTTEWKKTKLVKYKIEEKEELYRFKLEDGREIIATEEHPLLVFHNDVLLWKKARNITKDDKLVVLTDLPEVKNDKESLRIARLLGFVLADGTINIMKGRFKDGRGNWYNGVKKRIRITTSSLEIANQAKKDFEEEFACKVRIDKRKDKNCYDVVVTSGKVVDRIVQLGVPPGRKAKKIRVPKIVWESSNEFKSQFLSALFSCDGYVSKNGERIEYYTASKEFARELQLLLSHFSIEASIREKNTFYGKYYIIRFSDYSSLMNFKNRIGFVQTRKNLRLSRKKFGVRKRKVKTTYLNDLLACRKIIEIEKIKGVNEVFDLVVDDNHSFIANGIVSHNSGKSYSGGVIAEEIALLPEEYRKNLCVVMVDTMGIYWSMKYPNEAQMSLLSSWGLQPKGLGDRVKVYVPFKQFEEFKSAGIPVDFGVSVEPWRFDAEDWSLAFNLPRTNPLAIALEKTINRMKERNEKFLVPDIITEIRDDREI